MTTVSLTYYHDSKNHGNFGDELSPFIIQELLSSEYKLLLNAPEADHSLLGIGSIIHLSKENDYVFGSGLGVLEPESLPHLNICAVRGPLTRETLAHYKIDCPEVYGDAALLLPKFYTPTYCEGLSTKIGFVPHFNHYDTYASLELPENFHLIDPTMEWRQVIDEITSCHSIVSQSLHGLICADAYNIPNIRFAENFWFCNMCHSLNTQSGLNLDETFNLSTSGDERPSCVCGWKYNCWGNNLLHHNGDFKFHDYFMSQGRESISLTTLESYDETLLYTDGNQIDLELLTSVFPF